MKIYYILIRIEKPQGIFEDAYVCAEIKSFDFNIINRLKIVVVISSGYKHTSGAMNIILN